MSTERLDPAGPIAVDPAPADDEYATLNLSTSWPVLSLLCFVGALGARFLVRLIPAEVVGWPWRLILPALGVLALSLLGLVFGLIGLRTPEHRGLSRVGALVNGIALLLGLAMAGMFFWILRR